MTHEDKYCPDLFLFFLTHWNDNTKVLVNRKLASVVTMYKEHLSLIQYCSCTFSHAHMISLYAAVGFFHIIWEKVWLLYCFEEKYFIQIPV